MDLFLSDSNFSQVKFLKISVKIMVSISVLSMLFSQTSLVAELLNYFGFDAFTFSIKIFDYNAERNYIFLLCNGILAFIIKNSGLISNFEGNSSFTGVKVEKDQKFVVAKLPMEDAEVMEEDGAENGISVKAKDEEEEVESDNFPETDQNLGDEEPEDEEEIELPSAEELNKKCDDFIKKMRECMRVDFQIPTA